MKEIRWVDNHIEIDPPKRTKKITGTRFATILGKNVWATPFQMWCAITKTYEEPFEGTIYTEAGKTIEPKQAEYMRKAYGVKIVTPEDVYGKDYFSKTWGDFFPKNKHLGGMWDYLGLDEDGEIDTVFEMKTTKRVEDWKDDVPEYYSLQASLYGYLMGVDDIVMVASFLEDSDYEHPEKFKPTVNNTITVEFKISEKYPNFAEMVAEAEAWWKNHVDTGISPDFDEKADADFLKALRTNSLSPNTDIDSLIAEGESLKSEIDEVTKSIADKEKRLKKINDIIKKHATEQFRDGDKKVEIKGDKFTWTLAKTESQKTVYDDDLLKSDGVFDKYAKVEPSVSYRLTVK